MFTGIIEKVTMIQAVSSTPVGKRFTINLEELAEGTKIGDSIAVNGVCLTVSTLGGAVAEFDVMAETLKVSTLEKFSAGSIVNLERAMAAGGRFGGHFVQGHVDGIGHISQIEQKGGQCLIYVRPPKELVKHMLRKGSVSIDGISLTIVDISTDQFYVSLIPTTLKDTNLGSKKTGDAVNLEADIVSKMINARLDDVISGGLSEEKLRTLGF